ncbi:hypothetical protein ABWL39_08975 [Chitinivorax sp. PXF-14]|uniref:hypothetical protein n=1 Tax=Chitinivorax sp. PXF-14 TaxID=3230488 RepID=UPI003467E158
MLSNPENVDLMLWLMSDTFHDRRHQETQGRRKVDGWTDVGGLLVGPGPRTPALFNTAVNDDAFYPGGRLVFLAAQIIRCAVSVKTCAKQIISRSKNSNSAQNIKASLFSASLLFRLGFFAFLDPLSLCQFDHHPTRSVGKFYNRQKYRAM